MVVNALSVWCWRLFAAFQPISTQSPAVLQQHFTAPTKTLARIFLLYSYSYYSVISSMQVAGLDTSYLLLRVLCNFATPRVRAVRMFAFPSTPHLHTTDYATVLSGFSLTSLYLRTAAILFACRAFPFLRLNCFRSSSGKHYKPSLSKMQYHFA